MYIFNNYYIYYISNFVSRWFLGWKKEMPHTTWPQISAHLARLEAATNGNFRHQDFSVIRDNRLRCTLLHTLLVFSDTPEIPVSRSHSSHRSWAGWAELCQRQEWTDRKSRQRSIFCQLLPWRSRLLALFCSVAVVNEVKRTLEYIGWQIKVPIDNLGY